MSATPFDASKVPAITPEAAYKEMSEGTPLVLDVRDTEAYAKGHIKGALNIPVEVLAAEYAENLPDKNQRILVYCYMGHLAAAAVDYLIKQGYTNVVSFGGINTWPYGVVQ